MIGAEASGVDWGGWPQFMPATAHWRTPNGEAVLWMVDAHEVRAEASDRQLVDRRSRTRRRFGSGCRRPMCRSWTAPP